MKQDVFDFFTNGLGLSMEDAQPLYETFLESFGEMVAALRAASPDDEMELRRITHSIIGFSQNVGASDLFEAAKTLNACAKAHDVPGAVDGAAKIFALFDHYAG